MSEHIEHLIDETEQRAKVAANLPNIVPRGHNLALAWAENYTNDVPRLASALREQVQRLESEHGKLIAMNSRRQQAENEVERLRGELERKDKALDQALRQWRMYANDDRQFDGDDIATADDAEAQLYRAGLSALSPESRESK